MVPGSESALRQLIRKADERFDRLGGRRIVIALGQT